MESDDGSGEHNLKCIEDEIVTPCCPHTPSPWILSQNDHFFANCMVLESIVARINRLKMVKRQPSGTLIDSQQQHHN